MAHKLKIGLLKRFRYWKHRKDYEYPSREEMLELLDEVTKRYPMFSRVRLTVVRYAALGLDLNVVAAEQNMTRERVRQILWKAWRETSPLFKRPKKEPDVDSDV